MFSIDYQQLFQTIEELVLHHSPSGVEEEIDRLLLDRLQALGVKNWQDRAGNIIAKIDGRDSERAIAITAHKDEIGAIVKSIDDRGCLQVRKLGGSFPWVYGEGIVDTALLRYMRYEAMPKTLVKLASDVPHLARNCCILGEKETISGILCFGSRHVSHESPQKAQQENKPLLWEDAWVETKRPPAELADFGVRPGTRVVVGKHRKKPLRIKDYIASYTLDNKASIAILLALAEVLKQPKYDVYLVASAKEEVGAIGALYFTQNQSLDSLIALEICPLSSEYPIEEGRSPVLLSQDGYGIYDENLNRELERSAEIAGIELQLAAISGFGSDASIAMKFGHVARAACLSFPTQNTHGYEIAHLGAIANCIYLLKAYCNQ